MFKIKSSFFILLVLCFLFYQNVQSQLSKKHFIPPLTNSEFGNANPENQYFYISTPSTQNVSFTIKPIGQPSSSYITSTVSNTNSQEIFIGNGVSQLFVASPQTSLITNNKGYIVEADNVIYVSIRVLAGGGAQAGALVSKGSSALGTSFRVGSFTNENPQTNYLNFVSVMATENGTNIIFSDMPTGISIKNYTGSLPINVTLNEGESYIVATNSSENITNRDGLIGTLIESDKPIVVNTGSANGSFHNGGGRDYGIDQIVGSDKIGDKYIFVKGDGSNGWENALIVAHQNNTSISINGNTSVATINAGDYYLIEGNNFNSNGNMYVQTSNPVFAYQGIGANTSEANQGLFFVPPLSCENRGKVDNIPVIQNIGTTTFTGGITIVTNKNATVTINSQPIANFNTSGPFDVDGNSDYVTYKVVNLTNDVSIQSSGELYCAYFNQNGAASSGSFYSGFPSAPEINFDATIATLGNCIPNVTLDAANTDLFDNFEWFFDDEAGGGFISTGNTNTSFTPTNPGRYKLVATIVCSGVLFESVEVPVSLCPDDYDNDLIIDNLDVDLDNDGILNCDESNGDAFINITNINSPNITFQDSSNNSAIISSTFTQTNSNGTTNTFTGQANGDFNSTINQATTSNLKYTLDFTENINFKFTHATGTNHTATTGESFIIKVAPNNKNITLLDPDNQLLIDTNFDGVFETGITYISASEIHFTYNTNTTGTTPFQFLANQINHVTFEHNSANLSSSSNFNGNFSLTCFARDSDNDGIEDAFDIDSDNDGIPDIAEATSGTVTLSNIDTNLDGLDDVFNGITTDNDTDNDGVLNYLDLDSDNDGIYDLFEAGHGASDGNLDGIIDNSNTNSGINGLFDTLETTPDSNTINYTITDTDADNNLNFLELDSDNDNCFDVIEAGFTDVNTDGFLGISPVLVDVNGKVLNASDGYTIPNSNYITSSPIILNTPFEDQTQCEADDFSITIDSTADTFTWQVSEDNGTTWNDIASDANYSNETTTSLMITNVPHTFDNFQYRVILGRIGNSCGSTSSVITLTVNPLPTPIDVTILQCDDDADLTSDVNLTLEQPNISTNHTSETFEYFETFAQADAGTPVIPNPISYNANNGDQVWVRTITSQGCYRISQIDITISFAADVAYNRTFIQCDDFLDADGNDNANNDDADGITFFDFSDAKTDILAFFPLPVRNDLDVKFFETIPDRASEINDITNISNHRNNNDPTYANQQTIYAKIVNTVNNDCTGLAEFILDVTPVPTANPINTANELEECDNLVDGDATNGIVQNWDLEALTPTILGAQSATTYTVTYHEEEMDAQNGLNPIDTSVDYTNTSNPQTIYVLVAGNGCEYDRYTFDLVVTSLPVANAINMANTHEVCDNDEDGSAINGFVQNQDLEVLTPTILGTQDPANFIVTYHTSLALAQSNGTAIISGNYTNDSNTDIVYVRIEDRTTGCVNDTFNFTFQVNSEPLGYTPSNLSLCDNDGDGDDTNGLVQTFDLESQIPDILGDSMVQDQDDFNVTFHLSQEDATSGDTPESSPFTNTIINQQTIYVRIENKATGCINDDVSFDVIVNPLPDFQVTSPQMICLNNPPLTLVAENPNQVYAYQWFDTNGNSLGGSISIEVTSGGEYTVTATTTNGTNCSRTRTIIVNESNIASIEQQDVTIDDDIYIDGTTTNSITINNTDNNLGVGDYEFALLNEQEIIIRDYQDAPVFNNLEGGIYTIHVRDKNGCGVATLTVAVLEIPKFFTPNGDGYNDSWVIKGANNTFFPTNSVLVFDRLGKIITKFSFNSRGWNGRYKNNLMPSNDYWYTINLTDRNGNNHSKKGHFSLIRK